MIRVSRGQKEEHRDRWHGGWGENNTKVGGSSTGVAGRGQHRDRVMWWEERLASKMGSCVYDSRLFRE